MVKGTLSHPSPTPPSLPLCLLFAIRLPGAGCEVPNDLSPKINPISPHVPSCGCLGSLGVEGQEYWSGCSFLSPGDLPDLGIEPRSPARQANSLLTEPPGLIQGKVVR